jgi:hypothetical protein
MADQLDGIQKEHALLAIEFYAVGYLNMHDNNNRNVQAKFNPLCNLVFPSGTIFEYKNRLEDEIKRASQPLRYAHFGIGVASAVGTEEPALINPDLMGSSVPSPPPPRPMASGLLSGITGGGGGLRKTETPSPSVSDPIPPPAAAVAATPKMNAALLGALNGGMKKAGTPPPPVVVTPVPIANEAPPPAAVDAAPPQANLGGFSGSKVDSMLAVVKKIVPKSDEDSDAELGEWDD